MHQDEGQAADTAALWKTLRDRHLTLEQKRAAIETLIGLGDDQCLRVAQTLARSCERLAKAREKQVQRLLKDFSRAAARGVEERLDRKAEKLIEHARDRILKLVKKPDLSKEDVVSTADPARAELERLLTTSPAAVLAVEKELAERVQAWRSAVLEEQLTRDVFLEARDVLARTQERRAERMGEPADPGAAEQALDEALLDACRQAIPMSDRDRATLAENALQLAPLDEGESEGIRDFNNLRLLLGIGALRVDVKLCAAARGHSRDMVEHDFFAHQSPLEGKETPGKRAALAGTSSSAENIAAGQTTGRGANLAWWHSPGHLRNMLGSHARVGLGRHQQHWTQMFGR